MGLLCVLCVSVCSVVDCSEGIAGRTAGRFQEVEALVDLRAHRLKMVLVWPQIAPNAGNVARLCVATGTELHIVRPMGFVLSDKELRRSAMDYWPRLRLTVHDDLEAFLKVAGSDRLWIATSKGARSIWEAEFADGDWIAMGNETAGLPAVMHQKFAATGVRIPQAPGERCLNLATAAGIVLYEALRQMSAGKQA